MCRLLPCPRGLPQTRDGSASASHLSRPAQTSFALRPDGSLNRPRRPLSRGSNPTGYPVKSLVSYQINRQLSGWNLPPLMIHAFGAHPSFPHSSRRSPQTREGLGLKTGALLVREWKGRLERVTVLEEGFAWNGHTFGSLSQIAKAMTGTTWNGHRFFGLRQGTTPAIDVGTDCRKSRNKTAAYRANGASAGDASP